MTGDNKLIVIHGGDDGEVPSPLMVNDDKQLGSKYIFESTFEEVQDQYKQTATYFNSAMDKDCEIPELLHVFDLINSTTRISMIIEIKTPYND